MLSKADETTVIMLGLEHNHCCSFISSIQLVFAAIIRSFFSGVMILHPGFGSYVGFVWGLGCEVNSFFCNTKEMKHRLCVLSVTQLMTLRNMPENYASTQQWCQF